jgi:nucleoside diphosphate kinase
MERTLFLIKPDGVQRNLCKEIIKIIETKLIIIDQHTKTAPVNICNLHYIEHKYKDYYDPYIYFEWTYYYHSRRRTRSGL